MKKLLMCVAVLAMLSGAMFPRTAVARPAIKHAVALAFAQQAHEALKQGLNNEAADLFMRAYRMVKEPTLVFNAARSYQLGGKFDEAIGLFNLYLRISSRDQKGITEAHAHLKEIADAAKRLAEQKASVSVVVLKKPPPHVALPAPATQVVGANVHAVKQPTRTFPVWKTSAAGGLAALSLGLWLGARGQIGDAISMLPLHTEAARQEYLSKVSRGESLRDAAIGAVSAAAIAGGWAVWEYLHER